MKKIIGVFVFLMSILFYSQTAKEIIDKNIELSGGLTNWKLLNSVILHGKVILGINEEYPIKIFQQRPNLTKTVIVVGKKETTIEGYDGKRGYAMNYAANRLQVYPNYIPENFDNDFIDFEKKGFEAKYLGKEKVGDSYCHKVELTKNTNKTIYWFSTETYFLMKEEQKEETILYDEYKAVGKFVFPFRIESSNPKKDGEYVIFIDNIETNKVIPENTFKF